MENTTIFCRTHFLVPQVQTFAKKAQFWQTILVTKGTNEETHNQNTTLSLISSSSTTNPMENTTIFCRTPFFGSTGRTFAKLAKKAQFWPTILETIGTNEETHNQNTTLSLISSSSATNPMENTTIVCRTPIVVRTFAKNTQFWPTILVTKGTNEESHNQNTTLSLISSSSSTNPMENSTIFCQTPFFWFHRPLQIGKNTQFWRTILETKRTNEETHNENTTLSLISSSSTANPMENTTIFCRTPFFGSTGPAGPWQNW